MEYVETWRFGSLIEVIGDEKFLIKELKKLNIDGYKIEISKKDSYGINGTFVNVIVDGEDEYGHVHHIHEEKHHHHHHEHRNLDDINKIIDESKLDDKTKSLAKEIFLKVANAEAKVHNKPLKDVHFHEVGATDSIIDIVGTAILINKINPDKIISSIVNDGYGFIECAHGKMAVPVPATSEIFAISNVKFRQSDSWPTYVFSIQSTIESTLKYLKIFLSLSSPKFLNSAILVLPNTSSLRNFWATFLCSSFLQVRCSRLQYYICKL